jgi:hypothetical protein
MIVVTDLGRKTPGRWRLGRIMHPAFEVKKGNSGYQG